MYEFLLFNFRRQATSKRNRITTKLVLHEPSRDFTDKQSQIENFLDSDLKSERSENRKTLRLFQFAQFRLSKR